MEESNLYRWAMRTLGEEEPISTVTPNDRFWGTLLSSWQRAIKEDGIRRPVRASEEQGRSFIAASFEVAGMPCIAVVHGWPKPSYFFVSEDLWDQLGYSQEWLDLINN
jgi:hypothetical protein